MKRGFVEIQEHKFDQPPNDRGVTGLYSKEIRISSHDRTQIAQTCI